MELRREGDQGIGLKNLQTGISLTTTGRFRAVVNKQETAMLIVNIRDENVPEEKRYFMKFILPRKNFYQTSSIVYTASNFESFSRILQVIWSNDKFEI